MNNYAGVNYILTNSSFPKYVKIGYADDINKRLAQLNRSKKLVESIRKFNFSFRDLSIAVEKKLEFINNPNIKVINDRKVEYLGEYYYFFLTRKLLNVSNAVQDPLYFTYKDEILNDLKAQLESND